MKVKITDIKTIVVFFGFGFQGYFFYILFLSFAEDFLAGTLLPTSLVYAVVALCLNVGDVFTTALLVRRVPFMLRFLCGTSLMCLATLLLFFIDTPTVKWFFIILMSLASGVGITSCMELSSYYGEIAVTASICGTGAAYLVAPTFYTALTTWMCVPITTAQILASPLLFLQLICFTILQGDTNIASFLRMVQQYQPIIYNNEDKDDDEALQLTIKDRGAYGSVGEGVVSSKGDDFKDKVVNNNTDDDVENNDDLRRDGETNTRDKEDTESHIERIDDASSEEEDTSSLAELFRKADDGNDVSENESKKLSFSEKLCVLRNAAPHIIPAVIARMLESITFLSLATTLAFPSAPFSPRDHFLYYTICLNIGKSIGRIHLVLITLLCSEWHDTVRVRKIWIPTVVLGGIGSFLLLSSLYRFLQSVYIMLFLTLVIGFLQGLIAVNFAVNLSEIKNKDFALSLFDLFISVGIWTGAGIAALTEPLLYQHCLNFYGNDTRLQDYCITRESVHKDSVC